MVGPGCGGAAPSTGRRQARAGTGRVGRGWRQRRLPSPSGGNRACLQSRRSMETPPKRGSRFGVGTSWLVLPHGAWQGFADGCLRSSKPGPAGQGLLPPGNSRWQVAPLLPADAQAAFAPRRAGSSGGLRPGRPAPGLQRAAAGHRDQGPCSTPYSPIAPAQPGRLLRRIGGPSRAVCLPEMRFLPTMQLPGRIPAAAAPSVRIPILQWTLLATIRLSALLPCVFGPFGIRSRFRPLWTSASRPTILQAPSRCWAPPLPIRLPHRRRHPLAALRRHPRGP